MIKKYWDKYDLEQKEKFKSDLLNIVNNSINNEENFVKEKLGRVISEIAKREWPQKWKELFPFIFESKNKGIYTMQVTLIVLRTLAEDVLVFNDDLSLSRKKTLKNGFSENWKNIYSFLVDSILTPHFTNLQQIPLNQRLNKIEAKISSFMIISALQVFKNILSWIKLP